MTNDPRDELFPLVGTLKAIVADLGDLVRTEFRLARAELSLAVASGIKAGVWMAVAALLAIVAALLLIQAAVFGLAGLGLGVGWASLIVAAILGCAAAGAYFYGRSLAASMLPERTIRQVNRDVAVVQESLT